MIECGVGDGELNIVDESAIWRDFLVRRYSDPMAEIKRQYPFLKTLTIDYRDIQAAGKHGLMFADRLLSSPDKVIADIADCIRENHLIFPRGKGNEEIFIRIVNLPVKTAIRDLRNEDVGKFVSVEGVIRKSTPVRPRLHLGVFRCPSGHRTTMIQTVGVLKEPDRCSADGCTQKKLELITRFSIFKDSQMVRIQDSPEAMDGGEQPGSLDCEITDDIAGKVKPGDRVILNGTLRTSQRYQSGQKSTTFALHLEVNSIEIGQKAFSEIVITEADEMLIKELASDPDIFKRIAISIAPSVCGMEETKEAIALQLFGGTSKFLPDGTWARGDSHILLIGEPGIAKSHVLSYVAEIAPRVIYTSGKGTSTAGLTAAAVKDDFGDGWTLEAGALVLADLGVCVIDELGQMDKKDMSAMHPAMEQQKIYIAKAGITETLMTRCAILGAANPKYGRFDQYVSMADQIGIPPALLSRFDLIFVLIDQTDPVRDQEIAMHILDRKNGGGDSLPTISVIDKDVYRKYVAYARRNCNPILSPEARKVLLDYYCAVRSQASKDRSKPMPITPRQLEATQRLAESSARVRLSDIISEEDAIRAVKKMDTCLRSVAYDPDTNTYDIDAITNGTPKKAQDIAVTIELAIHEHSNNGTASQQSVIEAVVSKGYDKWRVEKQIEAMLRAGKLTEPRNGLVRVA